MNTHMRGSDLDKHVVEWGLFGVFHEGEKYGHHIEESGIRYGVVARKRT